MSSLNYLKEPGCLYRDIGDYLDKHGRVMIAPIGSSMKPLFHSDACQVVLVRPVQPLRKFDVVLYKGPGSALILHRIVAVGEHSCDIRGDNTYRLERGIPQEAILGVMEGFYRGNRYVSVEDRRYRCYVRVWAWIYPLRRAAWLFYQRLRRGWKHE